MKQTGRFPFSRRAFARAALLLALSGTFTQTGAQPAVDGQIDIPALNRRVTDLTGTLSSAEQRALTEKLEALETRKGSQVAVLILPTTGPETIEEFSIRVAEQWKIGRQKVDDGVLLIVAKKDRKLRIEVGYGLEGAVPDAKANRIINDFIVPKFKEGDFAGGIEDGVDRLIGLIDGEDLPEPKVTSKFKRPKIDWGILLVVLFFVGGVIRSIFGRVFGAVGSGLLGFVLGWFFISLLAGAGIGFVLFLLMIFAGSGRGFSGGGWSSGGGFSSGSWSSGGGGFSGGGGSFGGGGSSGSW